MKTLYKSIVFLAIVVTIFLFYVNRNAYITKYFWKYDGGGNIGDFVYFDAKKRFLLEGRAFYFDKKKIGIVYVCLGYYIVVKSEETKEIGLYARKGDGNSK